MHARFRRSAAAFSLIELLVAIMVIALLATIVIAVTGSSRKTALISQSTGNLRQLGQGALTYAIENGGDLPAPHPQAGDKFWQNALFPLLYGKAWPSFIPSDTGANLRGTVFYDPLVEQSQDGTPVRSYGWNWLLKAGRDLSDGSVTPPLNISHAVQPSHTALVATTKRSSTFSPNSAGSWSTRAGGKVLVCYLDGHVESLFVTDIPATEYQDGSRFWIGYE